MDLDLSHLLSSDKLIERSSDSDSEELLKHMFKHFPQPKPSVLKTLADAAIKSKKINSLIILIAHNANPTTASVIELIEWDTPNEVLLNFVLMNGTSIEIAEFVTHNIKRKQEHGIKDLADSIPECLKNLFQSNHTIRRKLLSGILNEHASHLHIFMLNLLITLGAKSSDFCQLRFKNFTPLHVATVLALESGKNLCN